MTARIRRLMAATLLASGCGPMAAPFDTVATTDAQSTSQASTTTPTTGEPTTTDAATTGPSEPVCCGCLCVDPGWSCASDTCLYADGTAAALAPEAGFLTIPAHTFLTFLGEERTVHAPEARMWYMFRPADESPESKPLVVFFNGGPGASSATLFGLNTNAVTLDPALAGASRVVANPHSWTRFANLLYLDPRQSGYSYDIAPADSEQPPIEFVPEHDAADFVHMILGFLARHPQIQSNPVILAGESYGGNRSAIMLDLILFPDRLGEKKRYFDPTLRAALAQHFAAVFPGEEDPGPERIASQFGHQVLIQPAITWLSLRVVPTSHNQALAELGCIPDPNVQQCDEPADSIGAATRAVVETLTSTDHLTAALGVDVTTIAWMYADERAAAVPRGSDKGLAPETDLSATFGALAETERYYYPSYTAGSGVANGFDWMDVYYGRAYLESMYYVRTFITDAGKDVNVYAPDIPLYLSFYSLALSSVVHDKAPAPSEARPGWLRLTYVNGASPGDLKRDIRFPHYPVAGHAVSARQPGELAADVCRWYSEDCPLP